MYDVTAAHGIYDACICKQSRACGTRPADTKASNGMFDLSMMYVYVGKAGRVVDTKASKGRKLRFDIQPKLVNFMFPVPDSQPSFAASLFENLFKAH